MSVVCKLCGAPFMPNNKGFLVEGKMQSFGVCPDCHDENFQHGIRFTAEIMVVPIKSESLADAIKRKIYICPNHYVRRNPKVIAFYIGGQVGAVTHLANVQDIQSEIPDTEIFKAKPNQRLVKWKKHHLYKLFKLGIMIELKRPIKHAKIPVQGRMYVSFKTFSKARIVEELFRR